MSRLARLLGHLALVALAAWALAQMFGADVAPRPLNLVVWLAAGALVHDLLLLPAYALLDRGLRALARRDPALLQHVRIPAVVSGALLLVWFPRILDRQPQNYVNALGHAPPDYLGRWLAITAGVALVSAAAYAARRVRGTAPGAPRPPAR
jgi:hypothetical protein